MRIHKLQCLAPLWNRACIYVSLQSLSTNFRVQDGAELQEGMYVCIMYIDTPCINTTLIWPHILYIFYVCMPSFPFFSKRSKGYKNSKVNFNFVLHSRHRRRKYGGSSPNSLRPISYFGSIWELHVLDLKTNLFCRKKIQLHFPMNKGLTVPK